MGGADWLLHVDSCHLNDLGHVLIGNGVFGAIATHHEPLAAKTFRTIKERDVSILNSGGTDTNENIRDLWAAALDWFSHHVDEAAVERPSMIVDCHQHFWDLEKVEYPWLVPEYGPIYRTFTPEELAPQLVAAGVDRTVLVQAANSYADTDSMLAQAAEHEWIGAVVGWVPLEDAGAAARVLDGQYLANPWFKGVRHLNHGEADPDWLVRPAVLTA